MERSRTWGGQSRCHATPEQQAPPCPPQVARYHSLHSKQDKQPGCLRTTAVSADGVVMAIQHTSLPIAAVQFHPESILTAEHVGMQMILNATKMKAA